MQKRYLIIIAIAFSLIVIHKRHDLRCTLGLKTCIATQNTKIPSDDVLRMLDECDDVTRGNIGAVALKMTLSDIGDEYEKNGITPLANAYYSLGKLYDGRLKFKRREWQDIDYAEIKRSCAYLYRDFYDESKWIR